MFTTNAWQKLEVKNAEKRIIYTKKAGRYGRESHTQEALQRACFCTASSQLRRKFSADRMD